MLKKEKTMGKRFIWFIFVLFSLLLLFGCGSLRKKTESEKVKKTGNIAGIVFDSQTMQPLVGANVYVEGVATIGTKSDTLGRFWLSSVPAGEYTIWATKIPYSGTKISKVEVFADSTSIVMSKLCPSLIPEWWWCWGDWDGKIIKTDSISFFKNYEKLLKSELK